VSEYLLKVPLPVLLTASLRARQEHLSENKLEFESMESTNVLERAP